ncbi:MAG: DUF2796 domain-containing protein [Hyphomicrobiaceae bacterium]|nr:DUF2796 domain-containing protein [Hyphomicrobiaceae bacterium]
MQSPTRTSLAALILILGATVAGAGEKHGHKHHDHHGHKTSDKRELGAHEHGQGKINIVVAGHSVGLELEAPGADIVGFEHEAKTSKQKAAIKTAEEKLAAIQDLVTIPAEAACVVDTSKVEHEREDEHSEFHARFELTCAAPDKITSLAFPYFTAFPAANELEVTLATDKGQSKHEVTRKTPTLSLGGSS